MWAIISERDAWSVSAGPGFRRGRVSRRGCRWRPGSSAASASRSALASRGPTRAGRRPRLAPDAGPGGPPRSRLRRCRAGAPSATPGCPPAPRSRSAPPALRRRS
jgi:hypothetical protein